MTIILPYFQNSNKPFIKIKLIHKNRDIDITAVVDSGSDVTLVLPTFAKALGIKYERYRGSAVHVGGIGRGHECVPFDVECVVEGPDEAGEMEDHRLPLKIHIPLQKRSGMNLLGTTDFFEFFDVTIKHNQKTIILEKV